MSRIARSEFEREATRVRRRIGRFRTDSVVDAALRAFREPAADRTEALRQRPWLIALVIKWACLDGSPPSTKRPVMPTAELARLCQSLWDMSDHIVPADPSPAATLRMMRRVIYVQAEFQKRWSRNFLLDAALLERLPANAKLRRLFAERLGLDERAFIDLSLICHACVAKGQLDLSVRDLRKVAAPRYPAATVDRFVDEVSRDYAELMRFFRSRPGQDRRRTAELVEFPVIARYPFLRVGDRLRCWHPGIFHHGMVSLVHLTLSEAGGDYAQELGPVHESHVVELCEHGSGGTWIPESQLKTYLPAESEVPDGLLSFPGVNVFIESKGGLYQQEKILLDDPTSVRHASRNVFKALSQAREASEGLRLLHTAPPQVLEAGNEFLLVVTNRDLGVGTGRQLTSICSAELLDQPDADEDTALPADRLFIVDIQTHAWLLGAARAGTIDLPAFLEHCRLENTKPATAKWSMDQHLDAAGVTRVESPVVLAAYGAAVERMTVSSRE